MSPVSAPSDRRFRRSHVKPSRKRRNLRRIVMPVARYVFLVAFIGYVLYAGA
jgi:hypothetical protein